MQVGPRTQGDRETWMMYSVIDVGGMAISIGAALIRLFTLVNSHPWKGPLRRPRGGASRTESELWIGRGRKTKTDQKQSASPFGPDREG